MSRYYRSTREAFPCERFPAMFGPYRNDARHKLLRIAAWFALFVGLGVILALGIK